MTGALLGLGAGLAGIFGVFGATRLRGERQGRTRATNGRSVGRTEATDATCALAVCAVARLVLGPHPVVGSASAATCTVAVVCLLAVAGAVWAADATVKVLGPLGLLALLVGAGLPAARSAAGVLLGVACGFLLACRMLRRRAD